MCLNNSRIPCLYVLDLRVRGGPQICVTLSSSASVHAQNPQVIRARNARATSPSLTAEQSPGQENIITCLAYLFAVLKNISLAGHIVGSIKRKYRPATKMLDLPVFSTILTH